MWIPKYRYKLFNTAGASGTSPREIEIEFGEENVNGTTDGSWLTHPAFTSLGVNGLWVGKFEATGSTSALTVKPNVTSLRNINISTMYNTAYNFNRGLDSHMMKNTEWGAMAYLTNSKYGRGNSEVWINNSSTYTTGCAGSSVSAGEYNGCQNAWNTSTGYHASTTDNISGIYDTSGGAWEYVMGNYNNTASSSGLNVSSIPARYKDIYTGTNAYANKILGNATGEVQEWNGDYAGFVYSSYPWFLRGGSYNGTTGAGVFGFYGNYGSASSYNSFRIVLSPFE